jgi:hypothetical protein
MLANGGHEWLNCDILIRDGHRLGSFQSSGSSASRRLLLSLEKSDLWLKKNISYLLQENRIKFSVTSSERINDNKISWELHDYQQQEY